MKTTAKIQDWIRGGLAGLAGGVAWFVAIMLFFGPAQMILANEEFQSAKMMAAFTKEPLPRAADAPWILIVGLLTIGALWGLVYTWLVHSGGLWRDSGWLKRGLRFGIVGWALMVPWFAFYLPWNVLREPPLLVALEMACWAGVLLSVGVTIAGVEHVLRRNQPSRCCTGRKTSRPCAGASSSSCDRSCPDVVAWG